MVWNGFWKQCPSKEFFSKMVPFDWRRALLRRALLRRALLRRALLPESVLTYHQLRASACYVGKKGRSLCIVCTKNSRHVYQPPVSLLNQVWEKNSECTVYQCMWCWPRVRTCIVCGSLRHGIENVERHLLCKFPKQIQRKSWSNAPPKLLACLGLLYKVVHKNGRLQKLNRAREIEFNFFTLWAISMKFGPLVLHVPGYKTLPQIF